MSLNRTQLLDADLERVFRRHGARLAYLFGSRARGTARPESDVDVAVLLDVSLSADERFASRLALIGELSDALQTDGVDVVILNDATPLLAHEALQGVLLYCSDDEARIDFQVRTVREYEDTAPLRKLLAVAMADRLEAGTFGKPVAGGRE